MDVDERLQLEEVRDEGGGDASGDHDGRGGAESKKKTKETHQEPAKQGHRPKSGDRNMPRVDLTQPSMAVMRRGEEKGGGERGRRGEERKSTQGECVLKRFPA